MPTSSAVAGDQRAAGGAGIVRGHVEHVDRAAIGRLEDAAPGLQPRDHRDRALLHAGRLVAHGHAENIAERQHARARPRPCAALARSKQGRPAASIFSTATSSRGSAPSSFASNFRPSASTTRDVVGVEHVAVGGEDMALGRNQNAALIALHAAEAAGPVDLDDLRLDPLDRIDDAAGAAAEANADSKNCK